VNDSVVFQGRITIENSGEMREALGKALRARPAQLSVNLAGVTYIDTSGLATLLEAERIARTQGTRMSLEGVRDQPRYLLEVSHLDRLFEMAVQEAGT